MTRRLSAHAMRTGASILALILLVVAALAYLGSVGLSVTDNHNVRTASITMPQTNGLVVGSRVLFRGVAIGKITGVTPSVTGVDVTWNYKNDFRIPVNSVFRVDNLSALGETYLGIIPRAGGGPKLQNGVSLAASLVMVPTTIDELSARMTRLLEQINAKRVRSIVDEINTALPADQELLSSIAKAGALLESTIVATSGTFEQMLARFQPLLIQGSALGPSLAASGEPVRRFSVELSKFLVEGSDTKYSDPRGGFVVATDSPYKLDTIGKSFLEKVQRFVDRSAPDLKVLGDAALPAVTSATDRLQTVDLSDLMKTALATAGTGNGLVVRIGGN